MKGENDIFNFRQKGYFVLCWVVLDQIFKQKLNVRLIVVCCK